MKTAFVATGLAAAGLAGQAMGAATITALDLRSNGVFGHNENLDGAPVIDSDGADGVISWTLTYTNLDIDGDASANDTVTFTVQAISTTDGTVRAFNQGADSGFGSLNDIQYSVTGVSGTTTDGGVGIVFDGFTGGAVGFGGNGDLISSATINGTEVSVNSPTTGAFQFLVQAVDFDDPIATIDYDNSVRDGIGTIVARNHDLQFSAVPEPASLALIGLGTAALAGRRRRA